MHWIFLTAVVAQIPVDDVDKMTSSLERGGLYAIISLLLFAVVALFGLKEWQGHKHAAALEKLRSDHATEVAKLRDDMQTKLLGMTADQTKVLTTSAALQERIVTLLARVAARLHDEEA
jgi:cell division protein FtsB